jgi:Arc/MetJ-type ribon-helix-helix transcriptional regulator
MSVNSDLHHISLVLPEHTLTQLDALVHHGHFTNRQDAVAAAVERLYT